MNRIKRLVIMLLISVTTLSALATLSPTVHAVGEIYYGSDQLQVGQRLTQNRYLRSANGQYILLMQPDSNLVMYGPNWQVVWATGTNGSGATYLELQTDGNVVLYRNNRTAVWATGTNGFSTTRFQVQNDTQIGAWQGSTFLWSSKRGMLVLPPGVKPTLNVFAYNIAEQTTTEGLNKVADTIASRHPDIILLNEVNVQNGGIEPIKYLQQRLGYPHSNYQVTTHTGWTGTKGIGIISRYQASSVQYYETTIPSCTVTTFCPQFGIAQYTIAINGLQHEIFSVRHAPMHAPSDSSYHWSEVPLNQAGHQLSKGLAASIPSDHVVIMGGDFNAAWDKSWAVNFRDTSGLTDTLLAHPDPLMAETFYTRKDYIYYRGPYSTDYAELRYGVQGASDHPYSQAILKRADSGPFPL